MRAWDVVVVGGGPAGARAAEVVAREGASVLILDRKAVVGKPNHCGEGVSEDCLNEIGSPAPQPWIRSEVVGCRLHTPNGATIDFPKRGFSIDRPAFDRDLLNRALAVGAQLQTGARVTRVEDTDGAWRITVGETRVEARYLVGAGGPRCPVNRAFGQSFPTMGACEHKVPAAEVPEFLRGDWLHFFHHERFLGGYGWVFDRGDEVAIGVGGVDGAVRHLDDLCRELGVNPSTSRVTEGGPIPFLDRPRRVSFPRAVLCGDAGGFTYPLTKGGVHGAVWSGRLAGEAVVRALNGNPGEDGFAGYGRSVASHPCRRSIHLRIPRTFLKFDNRVIDTIGRAMDGKVYTALPLGRCAMEILRCPRPVTLWALGVGFAVQRSYAANERFAW